MSGSPGTPSRYVVESDLGVGGMGVVHVALDTQLQRRVALKVVSPQLAGSAEFRERFHREAATLARLDSPHIIAIYDHGEQDGLPYLATQWVRGGDLGTLVTRRGPLPPAAALTVCAQVADALGDAHAVGVVHRDIKASNVLVRDPDAARLHVYLCDFGIAVDETSERLTTAGAVVGTWAYLAPERTEGLPATPSSDLYALGCLLWVCLTGETPYSGTDVRVAMAHVGSPVRQLVDNGPLARHLNQVLARTMAKDPAQRYADAAALHAALESAPPATAPIEALPLPSAWTSPAPPSSPPPSSPPPSSPPPSGPPSTPPSTPVVATPLHAPAAARPSGAGVGRRGVLALVAALVLVVVVATAAILATRGSGDPDAADDTSTATSDPPSPTPSTPTASTVTPPAPSEGLDASVGGDVTGDELGDAVVTFQDGTSGAARGFTYTSTGTDFTVDEQTGDAGYPTYGDLDADGLLEPLTTSLSADGVTLTTPEGDLDGTTYAGIEVQQDIGFIDAMFGDVDGDGDDDLVLWGQSGPRQVTVWALLADAGSLADPEPWLVLPQAHVYAMSLSLGDHDRDGTDDLLAVLPVEPIDFQGGSTFYDGTRGAQLYYSYGSSFVESGPLVPDDALSSSFQVVGDFSGDGRPLVALADPDDAGISVYEASVTGLVEQPDLHVDVPTTAESRGPRFAASDVDGDGDDDLVLVLRQSAQVYSDVRVAVAADGQLEAPVVWAPPPPTCTDETICIFAFAPLS